MIDPEFKGKKLTKLPESPVGVSWKSPSNIAFVKYWGKKGRQLPLNPSLSLSLHSAFTETVLTASPTQNNDKGCLDFYFEGMPNPAFGARIQTFLDSIPDIFPFIQQLNLRLDTRNTFPHSAGIASSASAFSALALCLCSLEEKLIGEKLPDFFQKASYVARLGSGSACRSIYGGLTVWGKTDLIQGSSDLYAKQITSVHESFSGLRDAIILVSKKEKKVSSSGGHKLMETHPFAGARIQQANNNISVLLKALQEGDPTTFIRIIENEALSLHALMMTSDPGYILMEPETLNIIKRIQKAREDYKISIGFTLDAGPNVHLIYFENDYEQVRNLIVEDLLKNDKQTNWIDDSMGKGPEFAG